MAKELAFTPVAGATVNIDVSNTSQKIQVSSASGDIDVRIHNNGTATVWIVFGVTTGLTATTTAELSIPPGAVDVLHAPPLGSALYVAAIAAASTGKIYFTPGQGI